MKPYLLAILAILALGAPVALTGLIGCSGGGSANGGFDSGAPDGTLTDTGHPDVKVDSGDSMMLHLGEASDHECTGLECQQNCATTTIEGKVYDPAGINPLYNVYVYVPNAPLDKLPDGPVCKQCQAPASGNPIADDTTKFDGTFKIQNAPEGKDIPVVLQLGKWRRHLTIPNVNKCSANTMPDGFFRLPKKQHETSMDDNIPLIAFTTGCDTAECFFSGRVGIEQSEFTGPTGTGRVHIYKGHDDGQTFPGGAGSATTLWATASEMMKYDIIFDACECSTYDRGGAGSTDVGYKNFLNYLNAGGRAFTTHYFYNFFADEAQCGGYDGTCQGQTPLPTVGAWEKNQGLPFAPASDCPKNLGLGGSCLNIDNTTPKGMAFADWYFANNTKLKSGGGEKYGFVGLTDLRNDMGQLSSSLVAAGTATPWLFAGKLSTSYDAYYFSFNTPVGTNPTTQCGRAIFSDVHLDSSPAGSFPSYCPMDPNSNSHAPNELALEFLFFDLSSCVQNDKMPPPPPPH